MNPPRPSFLMMLADDLGFDMARPYGHPYAVTPHLNALADSGLVMTQHRAPGFTCAPSRAAFMSGRIPLAFPHSTKSENGIGDLPTITSLLRAAGYEQAHFGKWHLEARENRNGTYGIDVVCTTHKCLRQWAQSSTRESPLCTGARQGPSPRRLASGAPGNRAAALQQAAVLCKDARAPSGRDGGLTGAVIAWLRSRTARRPFYANVWFHTPHDPNTLATALGTRLYNSHRGDAAKLLSLTPFGPLLGGVNLTRFSASMRGKMVAAASGAKGALELGLATYLANVWQLDFNVGQVLSVLDELQLGNRTLVVFSSDHGSEKPLSGDLNNMGTSPGETRGDKHTFLEGGVRVPFLLRWSSARAGTRSACVTSHVDLLPTIAELAGVSAPPSDGRSLLRVWSRGRSCAPGTRAEPLPPLIYSSHRGYAIHHRAHKLYVSRQTRVKLARADRGQPIANESTTNVTLTLYDLVSDPGESHPLEATSEPAAGRAKPLHAARQLYSALEAWLSQNAETALSGKMPHFMPPPWEAVSSLPFSKDNVESRGEARHGVRKRSDERGKR